MSSLAFALILTLWHADAPPDVYVMDSGLTGEDCIAGLAASAARMADGPTVAGAEWGCVIDADGGAHE